MNYKYILVFLVLFSSSCKKSILNSKDKGEESNISINKHFVPDSNTVLQRIVFGSCSNQRLDQSYWKIIDSKKPDLWIWMGDAIYSDTENMSEHKKEYVSFKSNKYYQDFIKKNAVIGTWDDHDYGVNDGGRSYSQKEKSKDLFLDFLDVPQNANVRNHKGVYTSYVFGKGVQTVKIYLLDNRTFKDDLQTDNNSNNRYLNNENGTILGEEQWNWLENEIKNSTASINIFVSGLQIIPDDHPYEKWGNFPKERQRFLDLLEKYKMKNPLILSGDRHFAELSEYTYKDFSENVTELTSSGLTHSYSGVKEQNAYRLGELWDEKNFAMLKINWGGSKVLMKLFIYDIGGKMILEHGIIGEYYLNNN